MPAIIARFALPGTDPVPKPNPREVSGRPIRLLAHERARAAASEAEATARRAERALGAAEEAAARAAEAMSRLWEARCVAELGRVEAGERKAQLLAERRALEELSSAEGSAGSRSESEGEEQHSGDDCNGGAVIPQAAGSADGTGTYELRPLEADGIADTSTVDEVPAPALAPVEAKNAESYTRGLLSPHTHFILLSSCKTIPGITPPPGTMPLQLPSVDPYHGRALVPAWFM